MLLNSRTFTGFDKNAFYILLEFFLPYFDEYTPFSMNGKNSLKRVGFGTLLVMHKNPWVKGTTEHGVWYN